MVLAERMPVVVETIATSRVSVCSDRRSIRTPQRVALFDRDLDRGRVGVAVLPCPNARTRSPDRGR
jgi:hypothetical protein